MTFPPRPFLLTFAALAFIGALIAATAGCDRDEEPPPQPQVIVANTPETVSLTGTVLLADRNDNSGIIVYAPGTSYLAITGEDGAFTISNVRVGRYEFRARLEGYETTLVDTVRVRPEDLSDDIPLTLTPGELQPVEQQTTEREKMGSLQGRVSISGMDDNSGVVVQVRGTMFRTVTSETGEFVIPFIEQGEYAVTFFKPGYNAETRNVAVAAGEIAKVDPVVLNANPDAEQAAPRSVEGTVEIVDRQGQKQNIFDQVVIGLEGTRFTAVPDGAGRFEINNVPAGLYVITATAPGYELRDRIELDLTEVGSINVGVRLDEIETEEDMKGSVSGAVEVEGFEPGYWGGIVVGTMGRSFTAMSNDEGEFTIDNLPVGVYSFLAQKEGYLSVVWDGVEVIDGEITELGRGVLTKYIEPPRVVFTDPNPGAEGVTVRREIPVFVRFSKKMVGSSVKRALSISPRVAYRAYMGKETLQSDFDVLYIELEGDNREEPARFDTTYTVRIAAGATDFEGGQLEEEYAFSFTTGEPEIIDTIPRRGQSDAYVSLTDPIVVNFNATLAPESIEGHITIDPEPFGKPYYRISKDYETGWSTLYVYTYLQPDTEYTVRIQSGIRTLGGDRISNTPYVLEFKTFEVYTFDQVYQYQQQ